MLVKVQAASRSIFEQEISMTKRLSLHCLLIAILLAPVLSASGQDSPQVDTASKDTASKDTAPEPGARRIPLNVDQQALASRFEMEAVRSARRRAVRHAPVLLGRCCCANTAVLLGKYCSTAVPVLLGKYC